MSPTAGGPTLRLLTCPVCGSEPLIASPMLVPWFCSSEDCKVLGWDPYSTLEENLMDARPVREFINGIEQPPTGP